MVYTEKVSQLFTPFFKKYEAMLWLNESLAWLRSALFRNPDAAAIHTQMKQAVLGKFRSLNLAAETPERVREIVRGIYNDLPADLDKAIAENKQAILEDKTADTEKAPAKTKKSVKFHLFNSVANIRSEQAMEEKFETFYKIIATQFTDKENWLARKLSHGDPIDYEKTYNRLIYLAQKAAHYASDAEAGQWQANIKKYQDLLQQFKQNNLDSSSTTPSKKL